MSTSPLTVLFATAPAPVGGLERVVQAQAIGLQRRGHRTTVVATLGHADPLDHPFVQVLRTAGVRVNEVRVGRGGHLHERAALGRLLAADAPDILHTHGYRSDLIGLSLVGRARVPIVSTMHGSSRLGGLSHAFEWLQQRAWRRFDAVVAVSTALADLHRAHGGHGRNVVTIPNAWSGVEPRLTRALARERLGLTHVPAGVPVLGFVARLIKAKGPDVFIDALAEIADRRWHAVLIGDGAERTALEQQVRAHGLVDRVTLPGHVDDATDLYVAFDGFVLSSRTEGTPIALFEAMAAACPIVASAVGGVPDVTGGDAAVLVPPEQPRALAAAIERVLDDAQLAERLSHAARARVTSAYGPDQWLAQHEAVYEQVLRRRRARR